MIKTEEFRLPTWWASYLINGDASGLTDDEQDEIDRWCEVHTAGPCLDADVGDTDITAAGDDDWGMCERCVYTFQIIEPILSDGEVIGY